VAASLAVLGSLLADGRPTRPVAVLAVALGLLPELDP
jgi:hypothetical protein